MTEIELQYYFHNINTGTMAEWIEQPTFPTASFSFHCIIVKVFYHIIFSPNYRVFSREFLDSSLLETSECQNSRSINFACVYSTCNHLLFLFSLSINLFVYVQKVKERFHLLQIKTGLLALSHQSHIETSSWWKPSCWRILTMLNWRTHLLITVKWMNASVELFPLNMGIVSRHKM